MKALFLSVCLGCTAVFLQAQSVPKKPAAALPPVSTNLNKPIPFDPQVKTGKLPNGLTYYIRKNTEPKNRAELRLVIKAGSVLESDAQLGLAHFMEHMAFNGTKNFPKNELVSFLQTSGVRFGADLNAYTSFDETVYQLPVPTDSVRLFERAFQILEDWAHNITLDPVEIDKERGVILEEWRLGRGAQQRMRDKYFPLILNNSQYANRLPIGKEDIIKNFKPEVLQQFYKDWYRPDLMAVIAVGDFDIAKVDNIIKEKFGRIPAVTSPRPRTEYSIAPHPDTKVVILTDPEQPNTVVQVITKRPEIKERTLNDLRESLKRSLFNAMLGNRTEEVKQQADPPFAFGFSSYGSFLGNLDAFTSVAVPKDATDVERAIKAVLNENARVQKFGFTATELSRAKQELLNGVEQDYKEQNKTRSSTLVGQYVQHFLNGQSSTGIAYYYEFVKKNLNGITLPEVNALVNQFIADTNRAVIVMAPEKDKDKLPTTDQILSYINNTGQNLTAYVDQTVNKPLLAKAPTPSPVTSEKKIADIGVTEWTLKNGIKVVLKPTNFKNDQILFSAISKGGTSLYDLNDLQNARFASTLISQGGTGEFNQIQLGKFLAGKSLIIYPYISELDEGMNGLASPKDLPTALELLHSYFTQPRKDPDVVKGFLSNQRGLLANQLATPTPNKVFQDTVEVTLGNHNPRRYPLQPQDLDQIDLDKALKIYQERFADASDFTFFFVGSFDEKKIRPLIEKYIGGLPAGSTHESFKDLGIRAPEGQISKTVYKGIDPKSNVQLVYTGNFSWTPENATQVDALAEVLEIKLLEKLREEESGVYGVSASGSYSKYPAERYSFRIGFGCAPENVDKLVNKTLELIDDLKKNGADPKDIAKFKAESMRDTELQLKDNDFWLDYLTNQYFNGDDLSEVLHETEVLNKVTPESTKNAAKHYFNSNFIKFVLFPEKK
ncbi:M16 family metallopeptidase [Arsenicibacter rosenii]|uniref:Peptidase M16 n=1 Tax=Arsenicibacter rosenii TaxID=1750698 RepID=A0A1S2VJR6_9BACT|nr:M16 family metallopeptidase [Arsenicibacter rosenii]OIN59002.1 peptidase M16 [Arsenicibacter rosenii]